MNRLEFGITVDEANVNLHNAVNAFLALSESRLDHDWSLGTPDTADVCIRMTGDAVELFEVKTGKSHHIEGEINIRDFVRLLQTIGEGLSSIKKDEPKPEVSLSGLENTLVKAIITGPVGSGKTQTLKTLADGKMVDTDVKSQSGSAKRKESTTVAMDYISVKVGDNWPHLHLYGTPGQKRFFFMHEVLKKGTDGVLLLIDNSLPAPLADLRYFHSIYSDMFEANCVALAITHRDVAPTPSPAEYRQFCKENFGVEPPVITMDPRSKENIVQAMQALLKLIIHKKQKTSQ